MPSIDKLRHNIRHAVSLSAFSPNLIHRIRYFFSLYSYFPRLLYLSTLGNSQPLKSLRFQSSLIFLHLHFSGGLTFFIFLSKNFQIPIDKSASLCGRVIHCQKMQ